MAKKQKSVRQTAPKQKWERLGFASYRQYLNAIYRELGYKSYSAYQTLRERGAVESTKGRRLSAEKVGIAGPKQPPPAVETKTLPDIAGLRRVSYHTDLPFKYNVNEKVGSAIQAWIKRVFAEIENDYPNAKIYSGAWRIQGSIAIDIDDNGKPIFDRGRKEEWSSHQEWGKMKRQILSLAKAYGNHEFVEHGRQLPNGTTKIFCFLIKGLTVSIVLLEESDNGKTK